MNAMLLSQFLWLIVLLASAWTVLMCLKTIGREVEYTESVHNLKVQASRMQIQYRRRLRERLADARERARESAERRVAQKAEQKAKQIDKRIVDETVSASHDSSRASQPDPPPSKPMPTAHRAAA